MKLFAALRYLRFSSFDLSTEQGRADERYRLAALSVLANVLSKGIAMVVMVLSVNLTAPYLGRERFGAWMTIASFVGMLIFLDLGVGNALTNKVAQAAAKNNHERLRQTISGGLGFLFALGALVAVLLWGVSSILPWQKLVKANDPALQVEVQGAVVVFSILFGFNLFTNGIQRVFAGLQRAFEMHMIGILGSFLSLFLLWIATRQQAGIPYLLLVTLGSQLLASMGLLWILVVRNLFTVKNILTSSRGELPHLLQVGGLFFVLQIGTMVGWGADSLIISSTLGASQVAAFSVVQRLFQFVSQPMNILNAPLWGAYADAHSRGENDFIRRTLVKSMLGTGVYTIIVFLILLAVGEKLVGVWTSNTVSVSLYLLIAYGSWAILEALGNAFAMFLNGCNVVRPQVMAVSVLCVLSIPIKLWLIRSYGVEYMLAGFVLVYTAVFVFFYGFVFRVELKNNLINKVKSI